MKQIPTAILHLDYVLRFLATNPLAKPGITFDDLSKAVIPPVKDEDELKKILDKLILDDCIVSDLVAPSDKFNGFTEGYAINIDGEYFDLLDGYSGEIRDKERADEQTADLAFGTKAAAAAAFGILIWSIVQYALDHRWFSGLF